MLYYVIQLKECTHSILIEKKQGTIVSGHGENLFPLYINV